jgi:hypothetical protein
MISEEDRLFQLLKQCRIGFFDSELIGSCLKFLSRREDYLEHPIYKEIVTWILNDNGNMLKFCLHWIKATKNQNLIPAFYPYAIKTQGSLKCMVQELNYIDKRDVKCPLFRSLGEINFVCDELVKYQISLRKNLPESDHKIRYFTKAKIRSELKNAILSEICYRHGSFSSYRKLIPQLLDAYFIFRFHKYESAQFFFSSVEKLILGKSDSPDQRLKTLALISELDTDNLPDQTYYHNAIVRHYQGSVTLNF